MKKIIFWLILFCNITSAFAQDASCNCFVKGIVQDSHTHQPIVGATLLIVGTNQATFTDIHGAYQINNLCAGTYELECRIIGYTPYLQKLDLSSGHEENFDLHEEEVHLNDVKITAQRNDNLASQSLISIQGTDLAATRGNSLAESLKGISGVSVLQTGSSIAKPIIHGMHSNRILIMNNGIRQEGQQWGSEHAPEIDPFIATRLSVVKGAAGVRYGSDAIGGVILVQPEELPIDQPLSGEMNAVGFSNGRQGVLSGTIQGGIDKLKGIGWRAQGTLKRGGNLRTPNYFLDNTGLNEKNFSLAAGYVRKSFGVDVFYSTFDSKIGLFSGAHIGSLTDLLNVIENKEPFIKSGFSYSINRPQQNIKHQLIKAEAHYHFNDGNRLQWTAAQQLNNRNEYDLHIPRNDSIASLDKPQLTFKLNTLTNDLIWDHKPLAQKVVGQIGVSTLYQYNLMNGRPLIPNFNQFNIGLFWIERYVSKGWELEAGLRYDYRTLTTHRFVGKNKVSNDFSFSNFSGTIGAAKNLTEQLSIKLNVGTAWRPPNVSELFSDGVHHGAASFEKGDETLTAEKAYNTTASFKYDTKAIDIELGGYFNYIADYIYLKPQSDPILTIRGAFPYFKYTQTNASFKGIDLGIGWNATRSLRVSSKLSYLHVYDTKAKDYLVMIPPNRIDSKIKYALPSWKNLTKSYIALENIYVAQQKKVPLNNTDFMAAPQSYHLWNFQVGTEVAVAGKNQLELSLSVQNIFNTTYRDYLNRFRYYADELGTNASLRLRWKFGSEKI
jgi:iron complex outermembrane receptor protein